MTVPTVVAVVSAPEKNTNGGLPQSTTIGVNRRFCKADTCLLYTLHAMHNVFLKGSLKGSHAFTVNFVNTNTVK